MRTSPAVVPIGSPGGNIPASLDEVMRALVGLVDKAGTDPAPGTYGASSRSEEILVDAEVDGSRYLLIRMPRPGHNRVQLSPREQEIVRMVAKGHPNKVIADVLNISSWTVCTHMRRIFAKLGVGSRAAMVAQLLEIGVLNGDQRPAPMGDEAPRRKATYAT